VKNLDLDSGIASVLEAVREAHASVWPAVVLGKQVGAEDALQLASRVQALLGAIDARLPQPVEESAVALKAVA
jgi:hypothetical protein